MAVNNDINIVVKAFDKTKKPLKWIAKGFSKLKGSIERSKQTFRNLWIIWVGALWTLWVAAKKAVSAANDQLRVEKQLEAVIKSTGWAAWLTANEVKKMASSLQSVTTIWDETILAWQNMLLTFTQIWKDVFPQATETLLDMATTMNNWVTPSAEQLSAQAIQLWKALNDPIVWVTALSRVWVKFTEDQKWMIKTLTESWDIMGAQKIILKELSVEFGWAAKAQAETFEWQMKQLTNTLWDVQEEIWKGLIPIFQDLLKEYKPVILEFANSIQKWFENKQNIDNLIQSVKSIIWFFKTLWTWIWNIIWFLSKMWEMFWTVAVAVVVFSWKVWDAFTSAGDTIISVWESIKSMTFQTIDSVSEYTMWKIQWIIDFAMKAVNLVKGAFQKITSIKNSIAKSVSGAVSSVKSVFTWKRATWWTVLAWQTYQVWEKWPELFTPSTTWSIIPNWVWWSWVGSININFGWVVIQKEADENRLIEKIKNELTRVIQLQEYGIS